jgi:hypothetical protein
VALKGDAAAEKSKDQLSRDFPGRSIFDFCNNICHYRKSPRSFDGADDPMYRMGMTAAEDIIP